jgi:hypothetical protein
MSTMYTDRITRVVPPRDATVGAGACRALACNAATTSVELDSDIFQMLAPTNTAGVPGSYGRARIELHPEGNDVYVLFGGASSVAANSAAVAGNTQCMRCLEGYAYQFELDPNVDKWLSARTINGGSVTATIRYRIISFPSQGSPGSG